MRSRCECIENGNCEKGEGRKQMQNQKQGIWAACVLGGEGARDQNPCKAPQASMANRVPLSPSLRAGVASLYYTITSEGKSVRWLSAFAGLKVVEVDKCDRPRSLLGAGVFPRHQYVLYSGAHDAGSRRAHSSARVIRRGWRMSTHPRGCDPVATCQNLLMAE